MFQAVRIYGEYLYIRSFRPHSYDFPTLSPEAGAWLLQERDVKIIGVDSISPDRFQIGGFQNHVVLLGANRLIVENLRVCPVCTCDIM